MLDKVSLGLIFLRVPNRSFNRRFDDLVLGKAGLFSKTLQLEYLVQTSFHVCVGGKVDLARLLGVQVDGVERAVLAQVTFALLVYRARVNLTQWIADA